MVSEKDAAFPIQEPPGPHPVKVQPAVGVAVRITAVLGSNRLAQLLPQEMLPELPDTVPPPSTSTESEYFNIVLLAQVRPTIISGTGMTFGKTSVVPTDTSGVEGRSEDEERLAALTEAVALKSSPMLPEGQAGETFPSGFSFNNQASELAVIPWVWPARITALSLVFCTA
jgi:hypothetical protein